MKKWTKNKLVHTVHRNSRKSDIHIHGPDIHIHGPNIHIYIIFMDMAIYEFLKVHTAYEILWTMPWTPWIVMRESLELLNEWSGAETYLLWSGWLNDIYPLNLYIYTLKLAHMVRREYDVAWSLNLNKIIGAWPFYGKYMYQSMVDDLSYANCNIAR